MEIRKINITLCTSLLLILFTACGGGSGENNQANGGRNEGGNGGSQDFPDFIAVSSPDVFLLPAVTDYKTDVVNPEYNGETSQAEITRFNAMILMEAFYQVTEPAVRTTASILNSDIPEIYKYNTGDSADACSSGSVTTDSYYFEDLTQVLSTQIMLVFTYEACIIEGTTTNGQLIIRTHASSTGDIYNFEGWFEKYQVTTRTENITLQGGFSSSPGYTRIDSLTVNFAESGVSYFTEDLTASNYDISGTFYHNIYGHVDVQNYTSGGVTFSGANETRVHATMVHELDIDKIQFSLFPADNLQYDNLAPVWAVFDYASTPNATPVAMMDDQQFTREDTITLSAGASYDGNFDFLSYSWELVAVPEACDLEINFFDSMTTEFSSPCRGEHLVRLNVFDGHETSSTEFTVNALAAPPEIANTEFDFTADENIDFSISMLNTEIDGPFTFRKLAGVEGINISADGSVSGTPISFMENGRYLVLLEVNNDHSRNFEIAIDVKSNEINKTAYNANQPRELGSGDWLDIDQDGNPDRLISYYNNFAIVEAVNNITDYDYMELRELSPTGIISMAALDVLENEGLEILLAYHDRVIVLSGIDYSILKTIEFPRNLEVNELYIDYIFVSGGTPGVVVSRYISSTASDTWFYNFVSDSETLIIQDNLSSLNPDRQLDVNGDGINELVYSNKIVYLDGSIVELPVYVSKLEDIDMDGQAELLYLNTENLNLKELSIEIVNPITTEVESSQLVSLHSDKTSISHYDSIKTRFKNIDSDPEPELLLVGMQTFDRQIDVYENNSGIFSYDQSYSIDDENLWYPFDSLAALTENSVGFFMTFDFGALTTLNKESGMQRWQTEFAKYGTHSADGGGLFKYQELPEGSVSYLCNTQKTEYSAEKYSNPAGRLTLDTDGNLAEYYVYQNVYLPSSVNDMTEVQNADLTSTLATFGFGDLVTLYDLENDQEIDSFVSERFENFISGDLNQDGQDELYAFGSSGLQQLDLESNTSEVLLNRQTGRWIPGHFLTTDFAAVTTPRLLALVTEDFGNSNEDLLYLYSHEYVNGELSQTYQTLLVPGEDSSRSYSSSSRFNLTLQDTNDDSVPELLVTSSDTQTPKLTDIWIFDDELTLLSSFSVSEDLYLVPNLEYYAKSNILGLSDDRRYPGAGYFDRYTHTRFVEIDSEQHQPIWYSDIFPGKMLPNTFNCQSGDLYSCRKSAVFESGVLFFD